MRAKKLQHEAKKLLPDQYRVVVRPDSVEVYPPIIEMQGRVDNWSVYWAKDGRLVVEFRLNRILAGPCLGAYWNNEVLGHRTPMGFTQVCHEDDNPLSARCSPRRKAAVWRRINQAREMAGFNFETVFVYMAGVEVPRGEDGSHWVNLEPKEIARWFTSWTKDSLPVAVESFLAGTMFSYVFADWLEENCPTLPQEFAAALRKSVR